MTARVLAQPEVANLVASAEDPSVVIINTAFDHDTSGKLCAATVEVLALVAASEPGNIALKVLATCGVSRGRGVVTHNLPALERPEFMQYFKGKEDLQN